MARLYTSGFELQAFDAVIEPGQDNSGTAPVINTSVFRSGKASAYCSTTAASQYSQCYWSFTGALGTTYYFRCYFYFAAFPTSNSTMPIVSASNGSSSIVTVQLVNKTTLALYAPGLIGSATAALSTNTWYCVETKVIIPSSGNGTAEFRLNGTVIATTTSASIGNTALTSFAAGINYSTGANACYIDDAALNDSTGTAQNGYPGPGSIVMLLPASDSANTGFTAGPSTTTNLYDAVNNTPPLGVASGSATATTQIEDANSSTTDNYQPNMQTYTAAGVPSTASINVVQGAVVIGNGSASTGRSMGLSVVSNPVVAETTSNTSGTAGTYPTSWKSFTTAVSYSPAVTPGTAPVMKLRKNVASTNIVMSSFMGMTVEYSIGYYFVGAGTNWSSASSWALTSGGTGGAGVPTALDDVIFDSNSGNCTIDTSAATCCSIDCTAGTGNYTGTLTHTTGVTWTIGGPSVNDSAVALRFSSGMTYTLGSATTSAITFASTNATQTTITSAGKTLGNVTFGVTSGTGSWRLVDGFTNAATATVTLTAGTLNTNSQTCSWGFFQTTNNNTRTITFGSSAITITGASGGFGQGPDYTGLTVTTNTATVTLTGANSVMTIYNINWNGLSAVFTGTARCGFLSYGSGTLANVTRTGNANTSDTFVVNGGLTVTGTLTVTGNSVTNRLLMYSQTTGLTATITAAAVSLTNVDFTDIAAVGAAAPFTGTSLGDCQGNSNITFDTPMNLYLVGSGAQNWSTAAWSTSSGGSSGARIPLPQDTVYVDANSSTGVLTANMPRLGLTLNFTGFTGTFSESTSNTIYGGLTLSAAMTLNWAAGGDSWNFNGRGSYTITCNGNTCPGSGNTALVFGAAAGLGTWSLNDDFYYWHVSSVPNPGGIVVLGTLITNNHTLNIGAFRISGGILTAGSSQINLSSPAGTTWQYQSGTITGTYTIVVTGSQTGTFVGDAYTYYNLQINTGCSITVTGNNTFNDVTIQSGAGVILPASGTQTVTQWAGSGALNGYLALPGVSGNYASTPDASPLDITGDITLDVNISLPSWAPTATTSLLGKYTNTASTTSYLLYIINTGYAVFAMSNGSSIITATSTVKPSTVFSGGAIGWLRTTRQQSSGTVQFYTSTNGTSWTQLGSNVTLSAGTAINNSTTVVEIGSDNIGTANLMAGSFYEARIYNGYQGAGTLVFDANFATKTFGANTFTESSSNAAPVTINGALAQVGDGRVSITSSTGGTQSTISQASGTVSIDYAYIKDSIATGGATFSAESHSIDIESFTLINYAVAAVSSPPVTTSAINTNGADLIVLFGAGNAGTTGITDSAGNTWTAGTLWNNEAIFYYCASPKTSGTHTFSGSSGGYPSLYAAAFSCGGTTPVIDLNYGAGSTSPGSATPSHNYEIVLTGVMVGGFGPYAPTVTGGFAIMANDTAYPSSHPSALASLLQTTATAVSPTWSAANASALVSFSSAGGHNIGWLFSSAATGSTLLLMGMG